MSRRALLVEDDDLVRAVLVEVLADEGCHVVPVSNGDAAINMLDAGIFDLLLTDVHMPGGIDGHRFVRPARSRSTRLPIVITTGCPGLRAQSVSAGPRCTIV